MEKHYFLALLTLLTLSLTAEATIRRVPQDYAKIQLAINAAVNGDTILVSEGTYIENIIIKKKIVVASSYLIDRDTSHISRTIINGSAPSHPDTGMVVLFAPGCDTTTIVTGFTITGGKGLNWPWGSFTSSFMGGGVVFYYTAGKLIKNIVRNNTVTALANGSGSAGGIAAIYPNNVIIEDNVVENNIVSPTNSTSGTECGGIGFWDGNGRMCRNIIRNNRVYWMSTTVMGVLGGGVLFGTDYQLPINVTFAENRVEGNHTYRGGGVVVYGGMTTANVYNNQIIGNQGEYIGGGLMLNGAANSIFSGNFISANNSARGGGIAIQNSATNTLVNNIIVNNSSSLQNGAGIYINNGAYHKFINNTVAFNQGGTVDQLYIASGSTSSYFMNCIFWGTTSSAVAMSSPSSHPLINCLVKGGWSTGTGIISSDPLFKTGDPLFRLSAASPALGAGKLTHTIGSTQLLAPGFDYLSLPRPVPALSNPDLGAIEHPLGGASTATILRVPQDYPMIQLAINAAVDGNIVLISEGLYWENLVLNKKITLASLFFTDGDTSHISKTIISGVGTVNPDSGSVINIGVGSDTNTVIIGLTITEGRGTKFLAKDGYYYIGGGGINILAGGATIRYNRIIKNKSTGTVVTTDAVGAGINIDNAKGTITGFEISDNLIEDNDANGTWVGGGGVYLTGSGKILRNRFINNNARWVVITGANPPSGSIAGAIGIYSNTTSTAKILIDGNLFKGNRSNYGSVMHTYGAESLSSERIPQLTIQNNIMVKNFAYPPNNASVVDTGLIHLRGTYSYFINNTIADNIGSYVIFVGTLPQRVALMNNIIWNPTAGGAQIKFRSATSPTVLAANFNCIYGGYSGIGNTSSNPQFAPNDPYYRLSSSSLALGAGMPQWTVGGTLLAAPARDFFGDLRPQPSTRENPDLGAVEHVLTDVETEESVPTEFNLSQNYPNPFNPSTKIKYSIPSVKTGHTSTGSATGAPSLRVSLIVYDILGRQVATLVNQEQTPGVYEVDFSVAQISNLRLCSGVYFYQLRAGTDVVITKKMILMK